MSNAPQSLVPFGDTTYPAGDGQEGASPFGERLRQVGAAAGFNAAKLADALNITRGTIARYWNGERLPPAELLFDIADKVQADAHWLVRGRLVPKRNIMADVTDADWIAVPTYDLASLDDGSKGQALPDTPIRRDWLNRTLGTETGLWLASAPCDYPPTNILEGDKVILRDIDTTDLRERHLCIWRELESSRLFIGRFSVARPDTLYVEPDGEYWIGRSALVEEDATLLPVGRILGRPIALIR